jgi:beta-lactamase class A
MNKRWFLLAAAVCAYGLWGCSSGQPLNLHDIESCQIAPQFREMVEKELGPASVDQAAYGMALFNRKTGAVICEDYVSGDKVFYPASSIKTLVAIAILRKVEAGSLGLGDYVTITQPNADKECKYSDCAQYGYGKKLTLLTLLGDMLTVSNNLATNQLMEVATKPFINKTAKELHADSLKVVRRLYDEVNPDPDIKERNAATARGLVQLYREVANGYLKTLTLESRETLMGFLKKETYNDHLNAEFPKGVTFYHKYGVTSSSASDAGFIYLGEKTVLVLAGLQAFSNPVPMQKIGSRALRLIKR